MNESDFMQINFVFFRAGRESPFYFAKIKIFFMSAMASAIMPAKKWLKFIIQFINLLKPYIKVQFPINLVHLKFNDGKTFFKLENCLYANQL